MPEDAAPQEIAEALRALRVTAGLSGVQLSDATDINRHKISKVERGHRLPNAEEIRAWVTACNGTTDQASALVDKLVGARTVVTAWDEKLRDGQTQNQVDYHQLIAAAPSVAYWDTRTVPGMLQTPDYARFILGRSLARHESDGKDLEAAVEKRVDAYRFLTDGMNREFTFIVWEPVLRTPYVPAEMMAAQLRRFAGVAVLANVSLGIVPLDTPLGDMVPAAFQVYGDHVRVEAPNDELRYDDDVKGQITFHRRLLETVMEMAVFGDDADDLVERAVAALR